MANILEILAGAAADPSDKRAAEDTIRNMKEAQLFRAAPKGHLSRALSPSIDRANFEASEAISGGLRGIQKSTRTGPYRAQALMKGITSQLSKEGLSPTKDREAYMERLGELAAPHQELTAVTQGVGQALDKMRDTQTKALLEQQKIGLQAAKIEQDERIKTEANSIRLITAQARAKRDEAKAERELAAIALDEATKIKHLSAARKLDQEANRIEQTTPAETRALYAGAAKDEASAALDKARVSAGVPQAEADSKRASARSTGKTPQTKAVENSQEAVMEGNHSVMLANITRLVNDEVGKDSVALATQKVNLGRGALNTLNDVQNLDLKSTGGVKAIRERVSGAISSITPSERNSLLGKTYGALTDAVAGAIDTTNEQRAQDALVQLSVVELARYISSANSEGREGSVSKAHLDKAEEIMGIRLTGTTSDDLRVSAQKASEWISKDVQRRIDSVAGPQIDIVRQIYAGIPEKRALIKWDPSILAYQLLERNPNDTHWKKVPDITFGARSGFSAELVRAEANR